MHPQRSAHSISRVAIAFSLAVLAGAQLITRAPIAVAAPRGPVTSWIGGFDDWHEADKWTNGVPAAGHRAQVGAVGTVLITKSGAVCQNLDVAIGGNPAVRIQSGNLTVGDVLHLGIDGTGTFHHFGGIVAASSLVVGGPSSSGAYLITSGMLSLESASLAATTQAHSAALSMSQSSRCTVTGSMHVAAGGSIGLGAGSPVLTVGTKATDALTLEGSLSISGLSSVTLTQFTMTPTATLNATLIPGGHAPIVATGPAVIDGTLLLNDLGMPDGSYELARGNPLSGGFDSAVYTSEGWSWRVAGKSLFADKVTTPTQTTSWGSLKTRYAD